MAVNFSGTNDRLVVTALSIPQLVSMCAWIKNPPLANGGPRVFENTTPTTRFFLSGAGDLIFHRRFSGTGTWQVTYANLGSPDWTQWHHIAVVHDGSSVGNVPTFYLDGVAYAAETTASPTGTTADTTAVDMSIGNRPAAARNAGILAWAGIYNKLLSLGEVRTAQRRGFAPSGRILLFSLQEAANYTDLSGNRRTATLASGAPTTERSGPPVPASMFGPSEPPQNEVPSYPYVTIRDTADRPNQGPPPGTDWLDDTFGFSNPGLKVVDNQFGDPTSTGDRRSYWNTQFGPNLSAYATISSLPSVSGDIVGLSYRVQTPDTAGADGYELGIENVSGSYRWRLWSVVNQVYTGLGTPFTQEITSGARFGVFAQGTVHHVMYSPSGSTSWNRLFSIHDTSTNLAGYTGLHVKGGVARLDDFGTGTVNDTTPPGSPTSLVVSEPSSGTIRVAFTMPTDFDTAFYTIRYKTGTGQTFSGPADGTQHTAQTFKTAGESVVADLAGFAAGSSYTIGVFVADGVPNWTSATTDDITTSSTTAEEEAAIDSSVTLSSDFSAWVNFSSGLAASADISAEGTGSAGLGELIVRMDPFWRPGAVGNGRIWIRGRVIEGQVKRVMWLVNDDAFYNVEYENLTPEDGTFVFPVYAKEPSPWSNTIIYGDRFELIDVDSSVDIFDGQVYRVEHLDKPLWVSVNDTLYTELPEPSGTPPPGFETWHALTDGTTRSWYWQDGYLYLSPYAFPNRVNTTIDPVFKAGQDYRIRVYIESMEGTTQLVMDESFKWIYTVRNYVDRYLNFMLPGFLQDSSFARALYITYAKRTADAITMFEDIAAQQYPQYATWSLDTWEETLGLPINKSLTLDQRRALLLARRTSKMERADFHSLLNQISGGGIEVTNHYDEYRIDIRLLGEANAQLRTSIAELVDQIKPAGIKVTISYSSFRAGISQAGDAL